MADDGDRVARIIDLSALGQALTELRSAAGLSIRTMADRSTEINGRPCDLTKNLIEDMSKGRRITEENLRLYLWVCAVPRDQWWSWVEALHKAIGRLAARPDGAHRVRDWNPVHLGVRRAIDIPGSMDELPIYVGRDLDERLRGDLRVMADTGGFLVLVGWSCAGKSRSAYESVVAELPHWWLVTPAPGAVPVGLPARTVVWLDELGEHFEEPHRLSVDTVRQILAAPEPVVIVGTMWPDRYDSLASLDSRGPAVEVLKMAKKIVVGDKLSDREQRKALMAARTDVRIAAALRVTDYGMTQTLAAAPDLLNRYEYARPVAGAIISAAIDAWGLGVRAPVSRELLVAAAPGYLSDRVRRTLTVKEFDEAFEYATTVLHSVTAILLPDGRPEPRYSVAEYLTQQVPLRGVPLTTWEAILRHVPEPDDLERVAETAQGRLLFEVAERIYQRLGTVGARLKFAELLVRRRRHDQAYESLADLLEKSDVDALRWAVSHHRPSSTEVLHSYLRQLVDTTGADRDRVQLAGVLDQLGRPEALDEWLAVAGSTVRAARRAATLLTGQGRVDHALELLLPWADRADRRVRDQIREMLTDAGRLVELDALSRRWGDAEYADTLAWRSDYDVLRQLAEAGGRRARELVIDVAEERGEVEEALRLSRTWMAGGDVTDRLRHAQLCERAGRLTEAIDLLSPAAHDNDDVESTLVGLLAAVGRIDDLCARADSGNVMAGSAAAQWLREKGDIATLTARARRGDFDSLQSLTEILRGEDRLAEAVSLWEAAAADDAGRCREQLGDVLHELGRTEEALAIAVDMGRNGDRNARSRAASRMADLSMWDELRELADKGDRYADISYVRHLVEHQDYGEIQRRAAAGSDAAVLELLAAARDGVSQVRGIDDIGLTPDGTLR